MNKKETIEELTNIELWEDLVYWVEQAQSRSPSFVDEIFTIIKETLTEMKTRLVEESK